MQKLMLWSEKHPIAVIIIIVLVSLLSAFKIKDIRIDASAEGMRIKGDPAEDYYRETLERFGTDNLAVIYVQDKNLFTPEKLNRLWDLQGELESKLERIVDKKSDAPELKEAGDDLMVELSDLESAVKSSEDSAAEPTSTVNRVVTKVESLFTVTNFKGENGVLNASPLMDYPPDDVETATKIKQNALANPILVRNIISEDGSATTINLYVNSNWDDPNFTIKFSNKVDEILANYTDAFESIFQLGNTYTKRSVSENILTDQMTLVPLSGLVLLLTLVILMRSASGAVLPVITASSSVLWTAGFMGMVDIPLNLLTMIVPSLVIVIGSTEDIHILAEYIEGMDHHKGIKERAIHYMTIKCGTAITLTALTTFLGFLSISINKITILKQFGVVAAFGFFVNPIITCLVAPVYLKYFGPKKVQKAERDKGFIGRLIDKIADYVIAVIKLNRWVVLGIFLGSSFTLGLFTLKVKVNNDMLGYFKENSSIRVRSQTLHKKIAGAQLFYIRINSGYKGSFKKSDALKQIEAIQNFMEEKGWFDKTQSLSNNIALIHREMNDGKSEYYKVPDSDALIAQYMTLISRDDIEKYVTNDYSEIIILVRHNLTSSYELKNALAELDQFISENLNPHFIYGFTGENILINKAADSMATGMAQSLSLILVAIFAIMSFLFVNVKAGALSLLPNLFPIIILFGVMGVMDLPLNTGTSMVAAIAIGIAVDDTIHFMTRYNKEMRELQNQNKAMEVCIRSEITPIISTSIALALGFIVICFSNFVPVIYFGFLSALVMIFALLGDLFITPILLSSSQLITILDMLGLKLSDAVIKDSKLFKNLKPRAIKKVILLGKVIEKAKGELAVEYGNYGNSMFLIIEGKAKVITRDDSFGPNLTVTEFGPGEVFGEIAGLDPGPRSADIWATEALKYMEIDWNGLQRIQRIFPRIAARLFLNLATILGERLVHTDELLIKYSKRMK
jgi:predicted RND superfamily exporter protein/CRP-like cAMP-binding protein